MSRRPPTYDEVRELEPKDPKVEGYFSREAHDLCASDLLVEPLVIDTVVKIGKYILNLSPRFVLDDDRNRFIQYMQSGYIFTPNHSDIMDIITIGTLAQNYAGVYPRYIGKASLPKWLNHLGLIPVDRSEKAHSGWLKALLRVSDHTLNVEKRPEIIFPEGVINPYDNIVQELKPGVISLAKLARIVPIGIHGTSGLLSEFSIGNVVRTSVNAHEVTVSVGEPINLQPTALVEAGYDIPSRGAEQKEFMLFLLRVLMQEQLNRAVLES
jgi:1-acyl-sn-glycerol-3-phosphate acyltransferase